MHTFPRIIIFPSLSYIRTCNSYNSPWDHHNYKFTTSLELMSINVDTYLHNFALPMINISTTSHPHIAPHIAPHND